MSYPGYPPYQQGPPQGMPGANSPYPSQQPNPYNASNPPYPTGQAPFPPYPNQFTPGYGFGGPPVHMPQPMSIPGFPSQPSNYPNQTSHYSQQAPFPNQPSSFSNQQSGFPNQSSTAYPSNPSCNYPSQSAMYPNTPVHETASTAGRYSVQSNAPPTRGTNNQHYVQKKGTPTIFPASPFDPRADAETLRKAMKGFGTDEKAIIQVLANRTNAQRLEIEREFKTLYGKDMKKDLKSELSGRFEDLVMAMMMPLPQYYAKEIRDALTGIGTDEDTLIEVFCTMSNNEVRTIRAAYEGLYGSSLEGDLMGDTSGTFRRIMVSLCTANRDESMQVNPAMATQDAQALLQAGELRFGTDESTFNAILCQRNYAQLKLIFDEYQRTTGRDIEEAIKNEFSGDSEEGLLAIVRSVKDKATFFAKRIHESMKGMGTNDKQLIRLIITRSEVDMGDIKQAYQAKYGKSLGDDISSDTSGDYKKCLLAIIS